MSPNAQSAGEPLIAELPTPRCCELAVTLPLPGEAPEAVPMAAGEAAQRINDMPKVADMVQVIVNDAENILKNDQKKFLS